MSQISSGSTRFVEESFFANFLKILDPFFEMNEDQDQLTYNIVTMRTENSVDPDQLASLHHLIEWKSKVYTTNNP